MLIEAFELLFYDQQNIYLFIIGDNDNDYGKQLVESTNKLKSREKIYFTGKKQNIMGYYSIADIFVLPTLNEGRKEGCPVALLEAMACGLPVLASNISGINEIIGQYADCIFEASNWNQLYQSLTKFMLNIDSYKLLGQRLLQEVNNKYNIDIEVTKHSQLYLSLLNK